MTNIDEIEVAVERLFSEALEGSGLRQQGVRIAFKGLTRGGHSDDYHSEIAVDLFVNDNLVDVIECTVVRDGRPIATLAEFSSWVDKAVADASNRRASARDVD
jgi:hypothetical protein